MDFVDSLFLNHCDAAQIILKLYPILTVNDVTFSVYAQLSESYLFLVIILTCKKIRSKLHAQVAEFPLQVTAPRCEALHSFFNTLAWQ